MLTAGQRVVNVLRSRGILHQATAGFEAAGRVEGGYVGFDPTAASLHVGNLLSIVTLERIARCLQQSTTLQPGFKAIALVGGATGMIGDPSGRGTERKMMTAEEVAGNVLSIDKQLRGLLKCDCEVVNNMSWYQSMNAIEFVRDIGSHFRVGTMLARDSVKGRMENEEGISYTEFSYQLFQAYDFLQLHKHKGVTLQIGGSDQWGNITAGCDFVRRTGGNAEVHGLTTVLLTDPKTKAKLGKSMGNVTVWLDPKLTSPFQFYQYFLSGVEDTMLEMLFKALTFLPEDQIDAVLKEGRDIAAAHTLLADTITEFVHGKPAADVARKLTRLLFTHNSDAAGRIINATTISKEDDMAYLLHGETVKRISRREIETVVDLCVKTGACESKAAAKRMIAAGSVSINSTKVDKFDYKIQPGDILHDRLMILWVGKKNPYIVEILQ